MEVIVPKKQKITPFVPYLAGKRISLAVIEDQYIEYYYRSINDEESRLLLGNQSRPVTFEQEREWMASLAKDRTRLALAIVLNENGKCIGNISLFHICYETRSAESGLFLMEKALRGKGYGPEAKALILRHAFHVMGLNRIQARVLTTNTASIKSLEKSGYKREGILRQAVYRTGTFVDMYLYSILREDWNQKTH